MALGSFKRLDRVTVRVKDETSFLRKALNPVKAYKAPFLQLEDQIGARIIVFFLSDVELVRDLLIKEGLVPVEDLKKEPKPDAFGYESHHLVITIPQTAWANGWTTEMDAAPRTFEIQIRTVFEHAFAEPEHLIYYKDEGPVDQPPQKRQITNGSKKRLAFVGASAWIADQTLQRIAEDELGVPPIFQAVN